MKKLIKTACLALSLILVCLTLCSCNALDEKRAAQAFYKGEDIIFRGEVYKKLPTLNDGTSINTQDSEYVYLTKDDVPVLLSSIMGTPIIYSSNGLINSIYVSETDHKEFYCRNDLYDYLIQAISKNEFDNMCMSYYDYNNEKNVCQLLDDYLTEVFKKALESEPLCSYGSYFDDHSRTSYTEISIYVCDAKMMLMRLNLELVYDLNSKEYVLIDYPNNNVYAVPTEYTADVDTLVSKVMEIQNKAY